MPKSLITQQAVRPSKLQRAKELRREMTQSERKLWSRLRNNRLEGFHFRRQQIIEPYIADFYCHQAELVIEVDGSVHQEQSEYDRQRDLDLLLRGLRVVHFTNSDVNQNLESVLKEILAVCRTGADDERLVKDNM